MQQITKFLKEHQKAALISILLIAVFIGCSAVSAVHVAQIRAQTEQQGQIEQTENETISSSEDEIADSDAIALSDNQKALIDSYDNDTKKLVETLSASVWVATGGNDTVRFSDNQYVETYNGNLYQHSYAISRVENSMSDAGEQIYTIVFETDDGTHVVTYTYHSGSAADGSGQILSTISSSSMFEVSNTTFEAKTAVQSVSIQGLNSEVTQMFGGEISGLTDGLSTYCATNYPTASEATWDQMLIIDYETGIISTNFTLNTDTKTTIAVTYKMDTKSFSFGK